MSLPFFFLARAAYIGKNSSIVNRRANVLADEGKNRRAIIEKDLDGMKCLTWPHAVDALKSDSLVYRANLAGLSQAASNDLTCYFVSARRLSAWYGGILNNFRINDVPVADIVSSERRRRGCDDSIKGQIGIGASRREIGSLASRMSQINIRADDVADFDASIG